MQFLMIPFVAQYSVTTLQGLYLKKKENHMMLKLLDFLVLGS